MPSYLVWNPLFDHLNALPNVFARSGSLAALILFALVSVPIALAFGWLSVLDKLVASGSIPDPTVKPWDRIFHKIKNEGLDVGIIITLPDGRRLGGRFGRESPDDGFASSYPSEEQLLIGEVWRISEDGVFDARIDGTQGLLIDKKDLLTLEFVRWSDVLAQMQGAVSDNTGIGAGTSEASVRDEAKPETDGRS